MGRDFAPVCGDAGPGAIPCGEAAAAGPPDFGDAPADRAAPPAATVEMNALLFMVSPFIRFAVYLITKSFYSCKMSRGACFAGLFHFRPPFM